MEGIPFMEDVPLEVARDMAREGERVIARQAGRKAVNTKGPEERRRISLMANWTKKHGKNDAGNPYSKDNYYRGRGPRQADV
jgi:hypothetical protein